jgi:transcriptional regulatory protein GAL4
MGDARYVTSNGLTEVTGHLGCRTSALTIRICRSLALENLKDIANFVHTSSDHMRGTEWYTVYFALQACLTLMLSLVWEPTHESSGLWRESILATATWFRQVSSLGQASHVIRDRSS